MATANSRLIAERRCAIHAMESPYHWQDIYSAHSVFQNRSLSLNLSNSQVAACQGAEGKELGAARGSLQ